MKQYLKLLRDIKEKGTYKEPARENMPGTISLFGYQFRHNLQDGFPLLTTKKVNFNHIVTELLWFMKGDTNIKYLVDNNCNIWNEDAYNFYLKQVKGDLEPMSFDTFINRVKNGELTHSRVTTNVYKLGDCGVQYGKLWRNLKGVTESSAINGKFIYIDQLKDLIIGLKSNPLSRRHIIDAWNPATLNDMALNACHTLVQFNCRPLKFNQKIEWAKQNISDDLYENVYITKLALSGKCPKYYLDCQMYQRSADVFLGVPYNIASYALLTHIIAESVGMIAGEFVHTFGDVHIYDNHIEQVNLQLLREPSELPELVISKDAISCIKVLPDDMSYISNLYNNDFTLKGYNPQSRIKGKLSTGLK